MQELTRAEIVEGLKRVGLEPGEMVMTHSSMKSFGMRVEGGPATVIEAVSEAVGPEGTTAYPAFPFFGYMSEALPRNPVMEMSKMPSLMGVITETARNTPGFIQSIRPYHTVLARGARASWLVEGHQYGLSNTGAGSPFEKLLELDALILLLGVDSDANTFLHCCEEIIPAPYIYNGQIYENLLIAPDGRKWKVRSRGFTTSHPRQLNRIDPVLRERGLLAETTIGKARVMAMRAARVYEVVSELFQSDPYFLVKEGPGKLT
ncbi:MAG: AAC(3) family N-acetyltransferase [Gemmatimonadota bacterium]|nr:AAC(3) family N-acetyltransferase [Gemmatimonadota bacterium]